MREGYHPSFSAFNETPLTMWLCSSSESHAFFFLHSRRYSQSTMCFWNGMCLISSDESQFANLNPNCSGQIGESATLLTDGGSCREQFSVWSLLIFIYLQPRTVGGMSWAYLIKIQENGSAASIVPCNSSVMYSSPILLMYRRIKFRTPFAPPFPPRLRKSLISSKLMKLSQHLMKSPPCKQ